VRLGRAVEVLLHDAGADADPQALGVDLADRVHVARRVEHDPVADRLARQARAAAAGHDRDLVAGGDGDRRGHVGRVAREGDGERLAGVHRRVGGVQVTRVGVVADLAAQLAAQRVGDLGGADLESPVPARVVVTRTRRLPSPDGHGAPFLPGSRPAKPPRYAGRPPP
jgi:hypothetical protein